jgi:hypothetical protein
MPEEPLEEAPLIVETGEGISDANAYIDADYAAHYFHGERLAKWTALSPAQQESAIIDATQFIDLSFDWYGTRKTLTQGLNFPRADIALYGFSISGVPDAVKKATAEAVLLALDSGGDLFTTDDKRQTQSESIGPLSTSYLEKKASEKGATDYAVLNRLLRGLYQISASGIVSVKAVRT